MTDRDLVLGQIAELQRRRVEVEPLETYREIGIRSFGRGIFHKEPVLGLELGNKRVFEIRPDDVVLNNVFAWEGAVALASDAEKGMIGSHRFMTYVIDPEAADARYVRYFLVSERGRELLGKASPGSAGRNRTLNISAFEKLPIRLPNVGEQRRVATMIERADSLIGRATALNDRAQSLALAAQGALVADDAPRTALSQLLEQVQRPEAVQPTEKYRLLGARWYGRGLWVKDYKYGHEISASKLYRVEAGDFVYNRLFAWKGSFALARSDHHGCYVSGEFPVFVIKTDIVEPEYLLAYFQRPTTWDEAFAGSTGSTPTSRNRLKVEKLLEMSVPLPPIAEQQNVVKQLRRLKEAHRHLVDRSKHLAALPSSILNDAFNGAA